MWQWTTSRAKICRASGGCSAETLVLDQADSSGVGECPSLDPQVVDGLARIRAIIRYPAHAPVGRRAARRVRSALLIGAGGMGEVYRARDTKLNRDIAIKVLPDALAADPDRMARFEREAQALAALNHPNIAAVYAVTSARTGTGEYPAIVMELVEGEDLSQRLARGPLPAEEALSVAKGIADAGLYEVV